MIFNFLLAASCSASPNPGGPAGFLLPDLYKGVRDSGDATKLCIDSFDAIGKIFANVVQIALTVAGLLAVGFIIWGGIQFVMSQGEPERIKKAKETIVNAVIGLFLVILAFLIVGLVARAFTGRVV